MIKTVLIGICVVAAIGVAAFFYLGHSSKSGSAPGLTGGSLAPCPDSPNCVSSEPGTTAEKRVEGFDGAAWEQMPAVLEGMGAVITKHDDEYIAAEFTSATFGFVDDLELRKDGDGIAVRSASRVGYSDAGANAKRVAALRSALE